ncbi:MAG: cation transporter [Candidatus Micrarchaeota archaeon]
MSKEHKLELKGMTCGACETLIERTVTQNGSEIVDIDATNGRVIIRCSDEQLPEIKQKLAEKGFPEKEARDYNRGQFKRVVEYLKNILAGKPQTIVESRLSEYAIGSGALMLILSIIMFIIYPTSLQLVRPYLPLFILLGGGVLMTLTSYYHIRCYWRNLTCANGMMVGMTLGMMSGFLAGALAGATNGMFIGSVVGMALGIAPGLALGRHSGIMGAMEGIMAGIMAGTMGAMLSVMMITDNLILFLYILFGLCAVMVGSLSYMMHREAGETPANEFKVKFTEFFLVAVIVASLMVLIMMYGPKNGLIYA